MSLERAVYLVAAILVIVVALTYLGVLHVG